MNAKYANKIVMVKDYEIPAGEFDGQVSPIKMNAGRVLWKYNGKYNMISRDYSAEGYVWNAEDRWNGGHLIPAEYVEFVSVKA